MRATIHAALALGALVVGSLAILKVTLCALSHFTSSYAFDVPSCTNCASKAYPYGGAYATAVGNAWKAVNKFRKLDSELRNLCGMDLYDENGNIIKSTLKRLKLAQQSVLAYMDEIATETTRANTLFALELQTLYNDLVAAGVDEVNDPNWLAFYAEVGAALSDLKGGQKSEVGRILIQLSHNPVYQPEDVTVFIVKGLDLLLSSNPFTGVVAGFLRPIFTALSQSRMGDVVEFVNLSVGNNHSLLTEMRRLRSAFDQYKSYTDDEVKSMERDMEKMAEELEEKVSYLREVNLSVLASFLPSETIVGELRTTMGSTPSLILSKVRRYWRDFEISRRRYSAGERFLKNYENMRQDYWHMRSLYNETKEFLDVLGRSTKACVDSLSDHPFASEDLRIKAAQYATAIRQSPDPATKAVYCKKLWDVVKADEALKGPKKMWEDCRDMFKEWWGEEPPCDQGDYLELYSCCHSEFERRENEYLSSQDYLTYLNTLQTLESLCVENGLSDLLSDLYSLPRKPKPSELPKSYARLLSLLDDAKDRLSSFVTSVWKGTLSTDAVSEVTLYLSNPLPVPLAGKIPIPFDYVGYKIESNGMLIGVSGSKLSFDGRGEANVVFQALPVEIKQRTTGFQDGLVILTVLNPHPLPVEMHVYGYPMSLGYGADYNSGYLKLSPGASAVLGVPAIEVERNQSGDYAYFILRNVSPYDYRGTVTLEVNASSGPNYCVLEPFKAICKVNIQPGEEKILKFRGYLLQETQIYFPPPASRGAVVDEAVESLTGETRPVDKVGDRFDELLDRLKQYWQRAQDLRVTHLLPFDQNTLDNLSSLDDSLKPSAIPLMTRLDNQVRTEARTRTKVLETLAKKLDDPKLSSMASMARQGLLTGDYILPLALGQDVESYLRAGKNMESGADLTPLILLSVAAAASVAYVARKQKPRKRIPKF